MESHEADVKFASSQEYQTVVQHRELSPREEAQCNVAGVVMFFGLAAMVGSLFLPSGPLHFLISPLVA